MAAFLFLWALVLVSMLSAPTPAIEVGYWPFDGNGDDESSDSNPAVLEDKTTFVTGLDGNLAISAGSGAYATISTDDTTSLNAFPSGFTISLFFKVSTLTDQVCLIYKSSTFRICIGGTGAVIVDVSSSTSTSIDASHVKVEQWYHIAYSRTSDQTIVYLDGLPIYEGSGWTASANDYLLYIGSGPGRWLLYGAIDELRIYSEDLSPSEVRDLYTSFSSAGAEALAVVETPVVETGLVGYWPFNGNTKDHTSTGNHAFVFDSDHTTLTTDLNGSEDEAYAFDGSVSGMVINGLTGSGLSSFQRGFTISLFFKVSTLTDKVCLIYNASTFRIYIRGTGSVRADVSSPNRRSIDASHVKVEQWYHIAYSWTSDQTIVYLDGLPIYEGLGWTASANDDLLYIGRTDKGDYPLHGAIDELRIYSEDLSLSEVRDLYTSFSSAGAEALAVVETPVVETGLVGYWPFNGNTKDHTSTGNHAFVFDSDHTTLTTDLNGSEDEAYAFDGSVSSGMVINVMPDWGLFTISLFFKVSTLTDHACVTEKMQVNDMDQDMVSHGIYISETEGLVLDYFSAGIALKLGQWYHIAYSWTSDQTTCYLDGLPIYKESGSGASANDNLLYIGRTERGSSPLHGAIDELRIYSEDLSPSEVRDLYTSFSSAGAEALAVVETPVVETGLVGYWPFNGNTKDHTSTGNHAFVFDSDHTTLTTDLNGSEDEAYAFDGSVSSGMVINGLTGSGLSSFQRGFTISLFFKVSTLTDQVCLIYNASTFRIYIGGTGSVHASYRTIVVSHVKVEQWYHIAYSQTSDQTIVYLDGLPIYEGLGSGASANENLLYIGRTQNGDHPLHGVIDELRIYSEDLSPSEVRDLYTSFSSAGAEALAVVETPVVETGLVGYWPFNGNTKDHTSTGNHAFVFDSDHTTLTTDLNGSEDEAYAFDGSVSSGMVINAMTGSGLSSFQSGFTISLFFKVSALPDTAYLIGKASTFRISIRGTGSVHEYDLLVFSGDFTPTGITLKLGRWYHVVYSLTSSDATLYLDGDVVLETSGLSSIVSPNNALFYVGRDEAGLYPFQGDIDEIRLFGFELAAADVARCKDAYLEGRLTTGIVLPVDVDSVRYYNIEGWLEYEFLEYYEDEDFVLPTLSVYASESINVAFFVSDGQGDIGCDSSYSEEYALNGDLIVAGFDIFECTFHPEKDTFGLVEITIQITSRTESGGGSQTIRLEGISVNDPPELKTHNEPMMLLAGKQIPHHAKLNENTFYDVDGDQLLITAVESGTSSLPDWLSYHSQDARFSGFVPRDLIGTQISLTITATDGKHNATDILEMRFEAFAVNGLVQARQTGEDNGEINFEPMWISSASGEVTLIILPSDPEAGIIALPAFATVDATTGSVTVVGTDEEINQALSELTFLPASDFAGDVSFSIIVDDGDGNLVSGNLQVIVENENDPPVVLSIPHDQSYKTGTRISIVLNPTEYFSDPDPEDVLSYSSRLLGGNPLPAFLEFWPPSLETSSILYIGTPGSNDAGIYGIELIATDSAGEKTSTAFTIAVEAVPQDESSIIFETILPSIGSVLLLATLLLSNKIQQFVFKSCYSESHRSILIGEAESIKLRSRFFPLALVDTGNVYIRRIGATGQATQKFHVAGESWVAIDENNMLVMQPTITTKPGNYDIRLLWRVPKVKYIFLQVRVAITNPDLSSSGDGCVYDSVDSSEWDKSANSSDSDSNDSKQYPYCYVGCTRT